MILSKYLKDKYIYIFIIILNIIISFKLMLSININIYCSIFIELLFTLSVFLIFLIDYFKKHYFYKKFYELFSTIKEKSYITELIDKPDFIEGIILYESLKAESKYINDIILEYHNNYKDYERYIETWVHEVKTPIATSKLLIENNKNPITLSIDEEINKIDNYVEQVLYLSKSDNVEKDYHIKKISLKELVMKSIKRKSKEIINKGARPIIHDLDFVIFSDSKWIEFIIGQVIDNSLKYIKENPVIEFYTEKNNGKIILCIKDNGIGITEEDICRVFEKGFTGVNGRTKTSSTGIGLYLCKKLCEKLGIDINIESKINQYTIVKIVFLEAK